jgi:hypothetical protein
MGAVKIAEANMYDPRLQGGAVINRAHNLFWQN